MRTLSRSALSIYVTSALLSACGGAQSELYLSRSAPAKATAASSDGRRVRTDGRIAKWDLLYAARDTTVSVYRYWQHTQVGSLSGFKSARGACVDSTGNVYVVDHGGNDVVEYAHGGTTPMRSFKAKKPRRCAANQHNGDIAIANWELGVYVYRPGKRKPLLYTGLYRYAALGYDDTGDLLVTTGCVIPNGSCPPANFAYLPSGGTKLIPIDIRPYASGYFFDPTDILWDGKYWVIVQPPGLFRYSVTGSKATFVSQTVLDDFQSCGGSIGGVAIYNSNPKRQGIEVVGPGFIGKCSTERNNLLFWNYPSGGTPIGSIDAPAWATAISCARAGCKRQP